MTSQPPTQSPLPTHEPPSRLLLKPILAGGLMFAFVGLLIDGRMLRSTSSAPPTTSQDACQEIVKAEAQLSREQLARLLTIPERQGKEQVYRLLQDPYCTLPAVNLRAGTQSERVAYPLAFEPETKLIILYENDEYVGYRFSFE